MTYDTLVKFKAIYEQRLANAGNPKLKRHLEKQLKKVNANLAKYAVPEKPKEKK